MVKIRGKSLHSFKGVFLFFPWHVQFHPSFNIFHQRVYVGINVSRQRSKSLRCHRVRLHFKAHAAYQIPKYHQIPCSWDATLSIDPYQENHRQEFLGVLSFMASSGILCRSTEVATKTQQKWTKALEQNSKDAREMPEKMSVNCKLVKYIFRIAPSQG